MATIEQAAGPVTGVPGVVQVDVEQPRYDQSTYLGRVRHFMDVTDPRTLLTTRTEALAAVDLLNRYKAGAASDVSEDALWRAQKIKNAMIHPDTGEVIPMPFRMSAFVPANIFICAGLLIPNPGIGSTLFWQWVNQSYNVAVNHANRNASNSMSHQQIAAAYTGAVATSCVIAVGLGQLVKRSSGFSATTRAVVQRCIPFTAVASAGVVNVFMMRQNELKHGIEVEDQDGNVLGKSQNAGMRAVTQVATSRVANIIPILTVPPLVMAGLERTRFLRANPRLVLPTQLGVITACLATALPMTIALFPQRASVPVSELEPEFQHRRLADGSEVHTAYYNRGL